jgi:hypothetical protein
VTLRQPFEASKPRIVYALCGVGGLNVDSLKYNVDPLNPLSPDDGGAPDFVEVGEAGVAVVDAMRHQRCVQLVG